MTKFPGAASVSATSRTRSSATVAFSEAERRQVLLHLDAMFQSPVFRNSKRYCSLLRFVVERALDGQADQLKERTIGVEAFGRPADYDTNVDHSVRSAAGEVRRRLAQYYQECGDDSGVRIELTPGSYAPQIRFADSLVAAPNDAHPELVVIPLPHSDLPEQPARDRSRLRRLQVGAAVVTAAMVLAGIGFRSAFAARSAYQELWSPILASPNTALLCLGGGGPAPAAAPVTFWDYEWSTLRRMNLSDALALASVTSALRTQGKPYRILNRAHATTFNDLRQGPFILFGAMNNEWSLRLISGMRFTFARKDSGVYIADRQNPGKSDWSFSYQSPFDQPSRDYAIVTRLHDSLTGQAGLIVAGIAGWGTQAAGEFVSTPEHVAKLDAWVPRGWQRKNLQVVLRTDIIQGSSGPPVVIAAHVW